MFFYQWRKKKLRKVKIAEWHAFAHPKIALENASKYFTLNEIEKDIIKKHMWPLTIFPPVYKESLLVSFIDKYVSIGELLKTFSIKKK